MRYDELDAANMSRFEPGSTFLDLFNDKVPKLDNEDMYKFMIYTLVTKQFYHSIHPRDHNSTERESKGVGRDILISKQLFLELCGPRRNSFR